MVKSRPVGIQSRYLLSKVGNRIDVDFFFFYVNKGLPQNILLDFPSAVSVNSIVFQFQGGFVGKKCIVVGSTVDAPNDYSIDIDTFYPEDINPTQTFNFEATQPLKRVKIIFEESTDFYGRITVYKLDVIGNIC